MGHFRTLKSKFLEVTYLLGINNLWMQVGMLHEDTLVDKSSFNDNNTRQHVDYCITMHFSKTKTIEVANAFHA